jgi:hypothetical protein
MYSVSNEDNDVLDVYVHSPTALAFRSAWFFQ